MVMNANGSDVKTIGRGWGPKWSPNGRIIAFTLVTGLYGLAVDATFSGLIVNGGVSPSGGGSRHLISSYANRRRGRAHS
jgi:Tol biopolymer transport system component